MDETEGSDTTRYFTHTDHLGSVTAVTDSDGTLVWNNEYLPFGDEAKTTNSRFAMFTGKQKDVDTGLFYYNARWYDASLGRFVSQDPIRSGVNWYAYANVNPLKYTDPTGLDTKGIKFALNAGLIGGVSTDIKLSIDDDGNLGLSVSLAAGVSTPDLSATVSGTVSNADDIYSSAGEGVTTAANLW